MLNISSTASNEVGNYIVDGKVPNKTWYPNFECEYETIDNNGIQYYKTHYSVEDFDGKTDSYCVLVPYTDMNGNLCFIVIELDEAFTMVGIRVMVILSLTYYKTLRMVKLTH